MYSTICLKKFIHELYKPSDGSLNYFGNKARGTKFQLQPANVGYIERATRALNDSKFPGVDRMPVVLLKDAVNFVSKPLTLIYNASLERGTFHPDLKIS